MSRVAKNPVTLPKGVDVALDGNTVTVKGGKGSLSVTLHDAVQVSALGGIGRKVAQVTPDRVQLPEEPVVPIGLLGLEDAIDQA